MTISLKAYAKINLFLDVMGRREDGYHDIRSLMQTVSLYDTVTVSVSDKRDGAITLECDNAGVPCNEKNLAYRAAMLFYDEFGEKKETHIKIEKRIPVSAGLAGGSTDAATVFVALNRLTGEPFSNAVLCAIGKKLGADIPFCILGGTAEVSGIGDVLTPLPDMSPLPIVVVKDGEGVSTPEAYRSLDAIFDGFTGQYAGGTAETGRYEALLSCLRNGDTDAISKNLYNVFEPAILPHHSKASELKEFLLSSGAASAMMSGSGPSVFGIFRDNGSAERSASILNEGRETPIAFAVHPVGRGGVR